MPQTIEAKDLERVIGAIVLDKMCSIKADADSSESKKVTLRLSFTGVQLKEVFANAVSSAVIKWQNGPGRKQYTTWKDGQVVVVNFSSPGKRIETPQERKAKLIGLGLPEDLADLAVSDPEKFKAIMGKVGLPTLGEGETEGK